MGLGERLFRSERAKANVYSLVMVLPVFVLIGLMPYVQEWLGVRAAQIFFWAFFMLWLMSTWLYGVVQQSNAAKYLAFPKSHWLAGETVKVTQDILVHSFTPLPMPGEGEGNPGPEAVAEALERDARRKRVPKSKRRERVEKAVGELGARLEKALGKAPPGPYRYAYLVEFSPAVEIPGIGRFTKAIWVLPDRWEETFQFTPGLEMWHGSTVIKHPKAELAVFSIPCMDCYVEWLGEPIPVAFVVASSWHYRNGVKLPEPREKAIAEYIDLMLKVEATNCRQKVEMIVQDLESCMASVSDFETLYLKRARRERALMGTIAGGGRLEPVKRATKSKMFWLGVLLIVLAILLKLGVIRPP